MPLVFYGRSSSATQESGVAVAIAVDVAARPYVLPHVTRLTPDVYSRVARMVRAEPHTRRASLGKS